MLRQFQRVSKGDFSALARFREYDEMHYLARRFNEMVIKLQERNDIIQKEVLALKVALEKSEKAEALAAATKLLDMFEQEKKLAGNQQA